MDASSVPVLCYRASKRQGKVRRRVQELRFPSSSYYDFIASRPMLDLSHNESARMAADSLLSQGLEGYHEVLNTEGEVDFLSELEKIYIVENGRDGSTADPGAPDDDDKELQNVSAGSQSATRCSATSTESDPTVADIKMPNRVLDDYKIEVHFQSDSRAASMKDLIREFIRKAIMALAIVMDSFSDVELLCDLLEASRKRNVSVHLLLDHLNLNLFVGMWQDLKLNSKDFPKLSVRSVDGQTYCAKSGRKLTGQIAESFIITDWSEVLTGSYSFSWLSWQVHRNLAVLLKGSAAIPFHQEFHRLYSSSKPVSDFVTYIKMPQTLPLFNTSHACQKDETIDSKPKSSQTKKACHRAGNEEAQTTQKKAQMQFLSNPQSLQSECSKVDAQPLQSAGTGAQIHEKAPHLHPKPQTQPGALRSLTVGMPKHTYGAVCIQHGEQTNVEPLEKNQNKIQSHSKLSQTNVSCIQSQLTGPNITTTAEKNVTVQESNPLHAASPKQGQYRAVHYQSPFKKNSNLEHHNVVAVGTFSQQRNRDRLIKPLGFGAGLNTQRQQWYCSLNFKQKVDSPSDHPKVLSPSTSQQTQVKAGLLFPSTVPRGHIYGQDEAQRHHKHPHQHVVPTGSESALTAMRIHPKPQLQPDSKPFSPATRTKPHQQPYTSQQVASTQRLNWMPHCHPARPGPVARTSSFNAAYGMGQQPGWRPIHSNMNTSLGRSKSLNDRHSAHIKGAGHNPNITKT